MPDGYMVTLLLVQFALRLADSLARLLLHAAVALNLTGHQRNVTGLLHKSKLRGLVRIDFARLLLLRKLNVLV